MRDSHLSAFHSSARVPRKLVDHRLPPSSAIPLPLGEWPRDDVSSEDSVGSSSSMANSLPGAGASAEVVASPHGPAPKADIVGGSVPPPASLVLCGGGLINPTALSHLRAALGGSSVLAQALKDALGEVGQSTEVRTKVRVLHPL